MINKTSLKVYLCNYIDRRNTCIFSKINYILISFIQFCSYYPEGAASLRTKQGDIRRFCSDPSIKESRNIKCIRAKAEKTVSP